MGESRLLDGHILISSFSMSSFDLMVVEHSWCEWLKNLTKTARFYITVVLKGFNFNSVIMIVVSKIQVVFEVDIGFCDDWMTPSKWYEQSLIEIVIIERLKKIKEIMAEQFCLLLEIWKFCHLSYFKTNKHFKILNLGLHSFVKNNLNV